jgi:hypothetical protein
LACIQMHPATGKIRQYGRDIAQEEIQRRTPRTPGSVEFEAPRGSDKNLGPIVVTTVTNQLTIVIDKQLIAGAAYVVHRAAQRRYILRYRSSNYE